VFGIGGGGDVVGAVPTARLLHDHGVETTLGGVAWERVPYDEKPGPRSLDEVRNIEKVNDTFGFAGPDTRTKDGTVFTETRVARHYGEEVALIDITDGYEGVELGLKGACDEMGFDLVVGVDSGGDVLARGDEDGVESPLADGIALAVLDGFESSSETAAMLGVFGYGSDGELTLEELDEGIRRAASRDGLLGAWGLTPRTLDEMGSLLDRIGTTEASRLPVEAARGEMGEREIRDGARTVRLTPASATTFYLSPGSVSRTSRISEHVRKTTNIEEAHERLRSEGMTTELDVENERLDGEDTDV
ncbi:MAG: DUF1152 domain-containing protein, partial [Halobacteria archaeon]|nr:DUF1152 domain-containing protein [Halobacteria archaeon]